MKLKTHNGGSRLYNEISKCFHPDKTAVTVEMEVLSPFPDSLWLRPIFHSLGPATGTMVSVDNVHAMVRWQYDRH